MADSSQDSCSTATSTEDAQMVFDEPCTLNDQFLILKRFGFEQVEDKFVFLA